MFCKKCGYQIKEGLLFCPNCGEKAVSSAPNQHIEPKPQGRSLKKCAWYAPVSVIVVLILYFIYNVILNAVLTDRPFLEDLSTNIMMFVLNYPLILIVGVIIPLIFYSIAIRNEKKEIKKQVRSSLVAPILLLIIPAILYNTVIFVRCITLQYYDIQYKYLIVFYLLFLAYATVLSYFLTAKCFEKAEKRFFRMLRE